jgi:hypothetical protein
MMVGISNPFGIEARNSYTNVFARPLEMRVTNFTLTRPTPPLVG